MQSTKDITHIPYFVDMGDIYVKSLRERKIFIVEDNDMHSMMMDYLLSKENSFQIFKFKSGEECVQRLNLNPDIIILDYGLPGINGMETLKKIKKYNPRIPVLIITENNNIQIAEEFLDAGVYDYIHKGQHSFNKLKDSVDKLLQSIEKNEYQAGGKMTFLLICSFIILVAASCLISYLVFKR